MPGIAAIACFADLVVTGGRIYTMDAERPVIEALAVRKGVIIAAGSNADVAECGTTRTRRVDLHGDVVFPGFIDAHTHPALSGTELETVDLTEATTIDELVASTTEWAAAHPRAKWVQGGGWDQSIFEGMNPRAILDVAIPDRPVYLGSADAHSAWVNTRALTMAGLLTPGGPDPDGGRIERDADGAPTGVLRETASDAVGELIPNYTRGMIDAGTASALAMVRQFGITTFVDADAPNWALAAYRRFDNRRKLTARVYAAMGVDPVGGIEQIDGIARARRKYRTPHVQVHAAKFFLDGVIESETALMLAPYTSGRNGPEQFSSEQLDELFEAADEAGLQLHAHALGDGAVRQFLDGVQRLAAHHPERTRRPLAAHIEVIDPADVPRFATLGVVANFQPLWAYPDPYITKLTTPAIGAARSEWLYPIGAVVSTGGRIAAGSDWSVSSMNPWEAMEVAVTRRDPADTRIADTRIADAPTENAGGAGADVPTGAGPLAAVPPQNGTLGGALSPQHAVSLQTILAAYTTGGAYAIGEDERLGALTVGRLADFIVVNTDPFAIAPDELSEVEVLSTWLAGERVYARQ